MPVFRLGQPWDHPFSDLENEVGRLIQGVNLTFQGLRLSRRYPLINLYERPEKYILTAQLPGTRAADIDITVAGGILTLKGQREGPAGIPEESYRRQERFRGTWHRSLSLPDRVVEESMTADFSCGVLKITLPRAASEQPRQIPVVDEGD